MRWLQEIWSAASDARQAGADVRAVTVWALLGSYDWNCLVTEERGYYESGAFDVRALEPRETAVAALMRDLAAGRPHPHPVLRGAGWWRRPGRFLCEPVVFEAPGGLCAPARADEQADSAPPVLIIGNGALARLFADICEQRDIRCATLCIDAPGRNGAAWLENAIDINTPWAVVNALDPFDVDEAERAMDDRLERVTMTAAALAAACSSRNIEYLAFSSDLVFDGCHAQPYVETDDARPINRLGRCMAHAEREVLRCWPRALVVRTGPLFGLWQGADPLDAALRALAVNRCFVAAKDVTVSPTYAPDLVHACLDLLIDRESGILHLSSRGSLTCAHFAAQAAAIAGLDARSVQPCAAETMQFVARQPHYRALASRRAAILPTIDDALRRCVEFWNSHVRTAERQHAPARGSGP
jgi:dTDP-4-dehydrorhamnose reductase